MTMSDPIADMLTRIRNAQQRGTAEVAMPDAKLKQAVATVLQKEGYILSWESCGAGAKRQLRIVLKYYEGKPVIETLKRVSRPSRRSYCPKDSLPRVMGNLGVAIVSTNCGVMTDKSARKQGLGGEVLCIVA
ncbi:MAG: 30S ribosomal protein S8 [Candidatus Eutrophobiaceae bacterium]